MASKTKIMLIEVYIKSVLNAKLHLKLNKLSLLLDHREDGTSALDPSTTTRLNDSVSMCGIAIATATRARIPTEVSKWHTHISTSISI